MEPLAEDGPRPPYHRSTTENLGWVDADLARVKSYLIVPAGIPALQSIVFCFFVSLA